jgi:enoyl-CoA hydratase
VSRLAEPGHAVEEARKLAEQICLNAPVAVWESRAVVRAAAFEDDETLKEMTNKASAAIMGSEDLKEGLAAFIEKRAPVWKGR